MKAYYYISLLTDLVRPNNTPLIKEPVKDLCADHEDYALSIRIRYIGIVRDYPTAELHQLKNGAYVSVDGVEVFRQELVYIDPVPVEVPEEGD